MNPATKFVLKNPLASCKRDKVRGNLHILLQTKSKAADVVHCCHVDIGHRHSEHAIANVTGPVYLTADRLDRGLQQLAIVTEALIPQRAEFIDGYHVRRQADKILLGGEVRPAQGIAAVRATGIINRREDAAQRIIHKVQIIFRQGWKLMPASFSDDKPTFSGFTTERLPAHPAVAYTKTAAKIIFKNMRLIIFMVYPLLIVKKP